MFHLSPFVPECSILLSWIQGPQGDQGESWQGLEQGMEQNWISDGGGLEQKLCPTGLDTGQTERRTGYASFIWVRHINTVIKLPFQKIIMKGFFFRRNKTYCIVLPKVRGHKSPPSHSAI